MTKKNVQTKKAAPKSKRSFDAASTCEGDRPSRLAPSRSWCRGESVTWQAEPRILRFHPFSWAKTRIIWTQSEYRPATISQYSRNCNDCKDYLYRDKVSDHLYYCIRDYMIISAAYIRR
jgi:hypothetical protein